MDHRNSPVAANRRSGLVSGLSGFVLGLATSVIVAVLLVGLGGFLNFVILLSQTPSAELAAERAKGADAIAVLTGGAARLETGMFLLEHQSNGERLLISGVNPTVDRDEIRKLIDPAYLAKFDCCVDLDIVATDTIGNASETAHWAADHNYHRIIVVTAGYHMPRALAEMNRAAPEIVWIPHTANTADTQPKDWWRWPGSARLLLSEYMKFLAMQIRFRVEDV